MKLKSLILLFFLLNLLDNQITAQNKNQNLLKALHEKIVKSQYSHLDSMKVYLNELKKNISAKDSSWVARYHSILGVYYNQKSMNDSALYHQKRALQLSENIKDSSIIAKANQRIGVIYKYKSQFETAMEYFFKARNISYAIKDTLTGAMGDLTISQVYWYLKQYDKGFKQIDNAIKNGKKANFFDEIVSPAYIEKGNMYLLLGQLDSSLTYYKKAEKTIIKTSQQEGLVAIYSNIGGVYYYKNEMYKAIEYYKKAIDLAAKFEDKISYGIAKINLGEAYYTINQYEKAEKELNEGLVLFKKLESKLNIVNTYNYLYEMEKKRKNFSKALNFFKLKTAYKDSILNKKNLDKIANLEVKYKTLEKEKQLAQQELVTQNQKATIASQRKNQFFLLGGLGFVLLGSLIFYNKNKAKQKQELQEAILREKEMGFASVLKASEDERKRISKELHDGIAQEMVTLQMGINHLKEKEEDKSKQDELNNLLENCKRSTDEIRNVSHQMMPRLLMEKGLVEAVAYLLEGTFLYANITYNFEHFGIDQRFDERIEISLYRVLQELINNVVKHANATDVGVLLHKKENQLILFVEDNGIGFDNKSKTGHGVLNIKSRIDMIKGTVNYLQSQNSGTVATIKIPL